MTAAQRRVAVAMGAQETPGEPKEIADEFLIAEVRDTVTVEHLRERSCSEQEAPMSETDPDTYDYDEKIKHGEDEVHGREQERLGQLSDEAKRNGGPGDAGRPQQNTDGDPGSDPA